MLDALADFIVTHLKNTTKYNVSCIDSTCFVGVDLGAGAVSSGCCSGAIWNATIPTKNITLSILSKVMFEIVLGLRNQALDVVIYLGRREIKYALAMDQYTVSYRNEKFDINSLYMFEGISRLLTELLNEQPRNLKQNPTDNGNLFRNNWHTVSGTLSI